MSKPSRREAETRCDVIRVRAVIYNRVVTRDEAIRLFLTNLAPKYVIINIS